MSRTTMRILLGLLGTVLAVSASWAYVNGGVHHSTRRQRESEL